MLKIQRQVQVQTYAQREGDNEERDNEREECAHAALKIQQQCTRFLAEMPAIYLLLAAVIISNWIFTLYFHFSVDFTAKKRKK